MQSVFNRLPEIALPGLLADNADKDIVSLAAEDEVPFGRFLAAGTDLDKQAKVPALATDITNLLKSRGIAIHKYDYVENPNLSEPGNADKDVISALRKGRIYVPVEQAVTPDDPVYARFAPLGQIVILSFDADFVTDNDIDLKINEVAITTVPFNGTHAQTIADLATQIQANADVVSAVAAAGPRTVTIIAANPAVPILISDIAVTGGASQATGSFAESEAAKPATDKGKFRIDDDNGSAALVAANMKFLTSAAAGKNAVLEINL